MTDNWFFLWRWTATRTPVSLEPRQERTRFLHMRKQRRRSAMLISTFVFTTWTVWSLYFLNLKFQASSHLLWLYSRTCVQRGWKARRQAFSRCCLFKMITAMILSFRTDRSGQPVQTQIRLLLEEQSDQGLHCLLFPLHHFDKITKGLASLLKY